MPPRNISLTSDEDAVFDDDDDGEGAPADDAAPGDRVAQRQLDALRAEVARGLEALACGDYVEVDERDLGAFLEGLAEVSGADPRSAR